MRKAQLFHKQERCQCRNTAGKGKSRAKAILRALRKCTLPPKWCAGAQAGVAAFLYNGGLLPLLCTFMIVLGVESSCDETGLALYDTDRGLLSHALYSQVAMHEQYGGVVPELASRDHIRRAIPLLDEALARAGITLPEIDAIAYTQGPGLAGALLVGSSVACSLGLAIDKPVLGIHHLEGHLLSPLLRFRTARVPVHRPAGIGRPHAADARRRRGPVHHAR